MVMICLRLSTHELHELLALTSAWHPRGDMRAFVFCRGTLEWSGTHTQFVQHSHNSSLYFRSSVNCSPELIDDTASDASPQKLECKLHGVWSVAAASLRLYLIQTSHTNTTSNIVRQTMQPDRTANLLMAIICRENSEMKPFVDPHKPVNVCGIMLPKDEYIDVITTTNHLWSSLCVASRIVSMQDDSSTPDKAPLMYWRMVLRSSFTRTYSHQSCLEWRW